MFCTNARESIGKHLRKLTTNRTIIVPKGTISSNLKWPSTWISKTYRAQSPRLSTTTAQQAAECTSSALQQTMRDQKIDDVDNI